MFEIVGMFYMEKLMIDRISDLALFIRIAESGSLSAAANEFGLTPSAVSIRLSAIEKIAGTRLINRTTRHQKLTLEGEIFIHSARAILCEVNNLRKKLTRDRAEYSGSVKISASVDLGQNHLLDLFTVFQENHPLVSIKADFSDWVVDLSATDVDVAVRIGSLSDSALRAKHIATNYRIPVASPAYLEKFGRPGHPNDLKDHNCLTWSSTNVPKHKWHFQDEHGPLPVRVKGALSSNNGEVLRLWALAGKGIAYKAIWTVSQNIRDGLLIPLLPSYWAEQTDLQLVFLKDARNRPQVDAMIDFLFHELKKLDKNFQDFLNTHTQSPEI